MPAQSVSARMGWHAAASNPACPVAVVSANIWNILMLKKYELSILEFKFD